MHQDQKRSRRRAKLIGFHGNKQSEQCHVRLNQLMRIMPNQATVIFLWISKDVKSQKSFTPELLQTKISGLDSSMQKTADHTIKATKPGFMRNVGPKSSNEHQLSNPTETLVSIPVQYLSQEHIPHVPNKQVGQSREAAHVSIKNTQNKTNERAVKWTRVDCMPNIHNTDTSRVAINVGTKRGRMECMEDTEGNEQQPVRKAKGWRLLLQYLLKQNLA